MVPRRTVRFLIQAPSILVIRTVPRPFHAWFWVNRHESYYPYYCPEHTVAIGLCGDLDDLTLSFLQIYWPGLSDSYVALQTYPMC